MAKITSPQNLAGGCSRPGLQKFFKEKELMKGFPLITKWASWLIPRCDFFALHRASRRGRSCRRSHLMAEAHGIRQKLEKRAKDPPNLNRMRWDNAIWRLELPLKKRLK